LKKKSPPPQKYLPKAPTGGSKYNESFFQQVYDIVRKVPKGRVTSYGAIAAALGTKLSARMVGWAMNRSHRIKPKVPAHRVVNRLGLLTGRIHFDDHNQMQQLLEKEGVQVLDNQVQDFEKIFWDPVKELGF
jgi:methylated-DNA-protein-cysteine methyltransferase-like protein